MPSIDLMSPEYINTMIQPQGMAFLSVNGSEWKYCIWFKNMEHFNVFYNRVKDTDLFEHVKKSNLKVTDNDALVINNNFDLDDWEDFFTIYFELNK